MIKKFTVSIARLHRLKNRRRLANATAKYFGSVDSKAVTEEKAIAHSLTIAAKGMDFSKEP